MDCGMSVYGEQAGFIVDHIVICICCVTGSEASYLILNYLQVIKICGGNDWGPYGAGILKDGSCNGFVGVEECVFSLAP